MAAKVTDHSGTPEWRKGTVRVSLIVSLESARILFYQSCQTSAEVCSSAQGKCCCVLSERAEVQGPWFQSLDSGEGLGATIGLMCFVYFFTTFFPTSDQDMEWNPPSLHHNFLPEVN